MRQGSQGSGGRRGRNRSGGGRKPNQPSRNHVYDSNGPDVKVRGNAFQVYEKYMALARDAMTASEYVKAEGYYQHGEHYLRIHNIQNPPQPKKVEEAPADDPAESDQPSIAQARPAANDEQPAVAAPAVDGEQPQPTIEADQEQPSLLDAHVPAKDETEKLPPAPKRRPRRKKPVEVAANDEAPSDEGKASGPNGEEAQPPAA